MNIPERFWKGASVAVYLVVAFLAVLSVKAIKEIGYVGHNPDMTNTINVDGTGEAVADKSDIIATFSFSVTETAKTVEDAQAHATTKINSALAALDAAKIDKKDISTESYNVNPHYEYQNAICPAKAGMMAPNSADGVSSASSVYYCPSGKSVLTGYDVSQSIQVKVRDLSKAGAIFTTIGSLGVQNVNGLTFSVDKPEALQAAARAKAIDDARTKADALAKQLGVRLVRIVSFSENGGGYPRPMMYAKDSMVAAQGATASVPSVPVGEQKITSNVSITYEIQ
jgi:uncharacterized protein YggE